MKFSILLSEETEANFVSRIIKTFLPSAEISFDDKDVNEAKIIFIDNISTFEKLKNYQKNIIVYSKDNSLVMKAISECFHVILMSQDFSYSLNKILVKEKII